LLASTSTTPANADSPQAPSRSHAGAAAGATRQVTGGRYKAASARVGVNMESRNNRLSWPGE
jgi:hypothetical protein